MDSKRERQAGPVVAAVAVGDGVEGTDRDGLWVCGEVKEIDAEGRVYIEDTARTSGNRVQVQVTNVVDRKRN